MIIRRFVVLFWFISTTVTTTTTKSSSFSIHQHGRIAGGSNHPNTKSNGAHVGGSPSSSLLSQSMPSKIFSSSSSAATGSSSESCPGNDDCNDSCNGENNCGCTLRSNSTHIVWRTTTTSTTTGYRRCCTIQSRREAEKDCLTFLRENLMPFDLPFKETLGFPPPSQQSSSSSASSTSSSLSENENSVEVDGLDYGLIGPTIQLSLDAKVMYPWTDDLPKHIFFDYVLNYANLNEARTNWRPLLVDALRFNESDLYRSGNANITTVTDWVNQNIWRRLGKHTRVVTGSLDNNISSSSERKDENDKICSTIETKPIFFKSGQTPLIFDPMSTIAFGYASCTGISILFCNALRAVGVPARVVGTPAWYGNRTNGNHNWVEVYGADDEGKYDHVDPDDDDLWKFLEGLPANPSDSLNGDPCRRWFCDQRRYPSSKVYAAKMSRYLSTDDEPQHRLAEQRTHLNQGVGMTPSPSSLRPNHIHHPTDEYSNNGDGSRCNMTYFPLAWEWDCTDVPAVDRTDYYTKICQRCSEGGEADS